MKRILYVIAVIALLFTFVVPATPVSATAERYAKFRVFYDLNGDGAKNGSDTWASGVELSYHYCVVVSCGWVFPANVTTDANGYVTFFSGIEDGPTMYLVEVAIEDPTGYRWTTTPCPLLVSYSSPSSTANIYKTLGIHTSCSGEG